MKIPKIILSRPKLVVDVKCPKCNSNYVAALPIIETTCKNCNTKFETNAEINIYFSAAKKLLQTISNYNEVWLLGERDNSDVFHTDDLLRPRSSFEDDIYHTMLHIKHNFEDQNCYEVSKITSEFDDDYRKLCGICGTCQDCVTCIKCDKKYLPAEVETRQGKQKRYKCPECGFRNYKKTFINKLEDKCPYCGSNNIKKTSFHSDQKECPKCHSKNDKPPRRVPVYKLVIKRQKRNVIREE